MAAWSREKGGTTMNFARFYYILMNACIVMSIFQLFAGNGESATRLLVLALFFKLDLQNHQ